MNTFTTSKPSEAMLIPYTRRDLSLKGALFLSHNGDRRSLPDGWLSLAELTDQGRLLTLHFSVGKVRVRGHELDTALQDACRRCLGELGECGSPAPARGLWVTDFEWQFPVEAIEDLASFVPGHSRQPSPNPGRWEQETHGRRQHGTAR
jgi:hypothetical protein